MKKSLALEQPRIRFSLDFFFLGTINNIPSVI